MGCNAWNHSSNCDCGWGGDNGYGGAPQVVHHTAPNGLDWSRGSTRYDSYVDPNAICPVCGDEVFFYQSPYGGRVFFNELGPPWDKHGCTDTYRSDVGKYPVLPPTLRQTIAPKKNINPFIWQPFIFKKIENKGLHTCFYVATNLSKYLGKTILLSSHYYKAAPCFWRLKIDDLKFVEFVTYTQNENMLWGQHNETRPLSAEALNSLGWHFSIHWKEDGNKNWMNLPQVDLDKAHRFFKESYKKGFWAAANNLGVMFRDGLGVEKNIERASKYFDAAAQSLDSVPLMHLSKCFKEGLGVGIDLDQAEFLEELANLSIDEKSKRAPKRRPLFFRKPRLKAVVVQKKNRRLVGAPGQILGLDLTSSAAARLGLTPEEYVKRREAVARARYKLKN